MRWGKSFDILPFYIHMYICFVLQFYITLRDDIYYLDGKHTVSFFFTKKSTVIYIYIYQ